MTKGELKEIIKECIYESVELTYDIDSFIECDEDYDISSEQILEMFGDFDVDGYVEPIMEGSAASTVAKFGVNASKFNAAATNAGKKIAK